MDTDALHDLTAAYSLDALDEHDVRAYEEHLAHCERCREELASLSGASAALAYGVDAPAPPPELRERILDGARAERTNVEPLRPRWAVPAAVVAVVAAAAAILLAFWASSLHGKLGRERAATSLALTPAEILAQPNARRIPLNHGSAGALVVSTTGQGALVLRGLMAAPPGKTYEAWVISAGSPLPAGIFPGGGPISIVGLSADVPSGATVAVTLEPEGGSGTPTGTPLISARSA